MAHVIEEVTIGTTSLSIKFLRSVKTSSIKNSAFLLYENTATPVATPFNTISISDDYNSIARMLTLYYATDLKPSTTYRLKITGLLDSTGTTLPDELVDFTTSASAPPAATLPPEEPVYQIEDHSVKTDVFEVAADATDSSASSFYVTGSDPLAAEPVLTSDYEDGRITVKFSARPNANFVTSSYFVVQKKKIQRGFARWETVSTKVSLDNSKPWVYIDLPSTDATPVYHVADKEYFETGYKYRLRVLKDVGT